MLRNLSYLNLTAAVLYFLTYLQNGNYWAIAGLLSVVVFSWLVLRNLELEHAKWTIPQWLLSFTSLLYALFLLYSVFNVLWNAIEYGYFPTEMILLVVAGLLFAVLVLLLLFFSIHKILIKKTD